MKKTMIISVLVMSPSAFSQSSSTSELVRRACQEVVNRHELRINTAKQELVQIREMQARDRVEFVYPTFAATAIAFAPQARQIWAQISDETKTVAASYNQEYESTASLPPALRSTARNHLYLVNGRKMQKLILRDLAKLGSAFPNGNSMQFGDFRDGWKVSFAPTSLKQPALTIAQVRHVTRDQGNISKMIALRMEFRLNTVTEEVSGIPAVMNEANIEAALTPTNDNDRLDSSYYMFSSNRADELSREIKFVEEFAELKECREHLRK